jgi:hypothetical protein
MVSTVPADRSQPGFPPRPRSCDLWWIKVGDRPADWLLLDETERCRAAGFLAARERQTFVSSRAARRRVAATYLGLDPVEVAISRNRDRSSRTDARPVVLDASIDFSVSHTTAWVVIAVVGSGLVGVDIESLPVREIALARRRPLAARYEAWLAEHVAEGQEFLQFLVGSEDVSSAIVEGLDRPGVLGRQCRGACRTSAPDVLTGPSTRCSSWRAASVSASRQRHVPCGLIFGGQGSSGCHRVNLSS